jgi:uncharacterized membrane protein YeaQ/YmgE (transglycosylase-associated protein family)
MPLLELLILLVIAGLAGAIAEFLIGFSPGGMLFSVIVGVIGAYIGNWLANLLGVPSIVPITVGSRTIDILWSTLGSILLVGLLSLLRSRRTLRGA